MTRAIITRVEGDNVITAGGPYVITAQGIELISTLSHAAQQAADRATQSETNAAASAGAASGSATAASGSATSAAGSAAAAATAKTAAETAAGNAAVSATAAGNAATAASGSATAAAGSATSASDSATAAGAAKGAAETAATNAGSSATAAAGAATSAGDSAGAASGSATAAAGSATSASGSATAANTAKDAAETALNELRTELPNFSYAVTTLAPGSDATLAGSGSYPNITLTFGVPRGDPAQNPNFTASASTGAAGSSASVTVTGAYPDLAFQFEIPRGADGTGAVSSVALTVPTGLAVSNSPITSSGTLAITYASGYQGYTTGEASKLAGVAAGANNYTHPTTDGNRHVPATAAGDVNKYLRSGAAAGSTPAWAAIAQADVTGLVSALGGKADLVGGLIPANQLPAIAITDTFVVNNQAAMLALTAQVGDMAVRTDLSKTFVVKTEPATALANWVELLTPTDIVLSVNGMTGIVVVTKAHVGLGNVDNTTDANKPVSTPQQAALDAKLANNGDAFTNGFTGAAVVLAFASSISPAVAQGHFRTLTNSGAFTLSAPSGTTTCYTIVIIVTNAASGAGALTASGFNKVHGNFAVTASAVQMLVIEVYGAHKTLTIRSDT